MTDHLSIKGSWANSIVMMFYDFLTLCLFTVNVPTEAIIFTVFALVLIILGAILFVFLFKRIRIVEMWMAELKQISPTGLQVRFHRESTRGEPENGLDTANGGSCTLMYTNANAAEDFSPPPPPPTPSSLCPPLPRK